MRPGMFGLRPAVRNPTNYRRTARGYNFSLPRTDLMALRYSASQGCYQDDAGTVAATSGTVVRYMTDLSGKGRHATNSTATIPSLVVDGGALALDNTNGYLNVAGGAGIVLQDIFAVFRSQVTPFSNYAAPLGSTSQRAYLLESGTTQLHYNPFPLSVAKNGVDLASPFVLAPITDLMVIRITPSSPSAWAWYVGQAEGFRGKLYIREIVAYSAGLSAEERGLIAASLMALHGIR